MVLLLWLFFFCIFVVLIRQKFFVWCYIHVMYHIHQNAGRFIISGHLDAWKNFLAKATEKQNSGSNTHLSVTGTIQWYHNHKLVSKQYRFYLVAVNFNNFGHTYKNIKYVQDCLCLHLEQQRGCVYTAEIFVVYWTPEQR